MRSFLAAGLTLLVFAASPALGQDETARGRALALNERAVDAFKAGDPESALPLFRQALELQPRDATIQANAARCLIELGDRDLKAERYAEAARRYDQAVELDPTGFEGKQRQALVHYRQLRDREALAILDPLVRDHPRRADGHELLGQVLYRAGENRRAIEHWERSLQLNPTNAPLTQLLARVKREEAVEKELYVDLTAAHFAIKYDGAQDLAVGQQVARVLEDAYQSVGALLGRYPSADVSVVIYPGKTFRAATGAHGWVAGLYDGKIRVPAGGLTKAPPHEVKRVLTHEYTHALLRAVGGRAVPAWLHEGFAQVAEGRTRADARRHVHTSNAPTLEQLTGSFARVRDAGVVRILYAAACDLVHGLLAQGGSPLLADALDALGRGESLDSALRRAYAQDLAQLHAAWRATLSGR